MNAPRHQCPPTSTHALATPEPPCLTPTAFDLTFERMSTERPGEAPSRYMEAHRVSPNLTVAIGCGKEWVHGDLLLWLRDSTGAWWGYCHWWRAGRSTPMPCQPSGYASYATELCASTTTDSGTEAPCMYGADTRAKPGRQPSSSPAGVSRRGYRPNGSHQADRSTRESG